MPRSERSRYQCLFFISYEEGDSYDSNVEL